MSCAASYELTGNTMSKDEQDYEFLLEEVTEKYFVKCNAIGDFFVLL